MKKKNQNNLIYSYSGKRLTELKKWQIERNQFLKKAEGVHTEEMKDVDTFHSFSLFI